VDLAPLVQRPEVVATGLQHLREAPVRIEQAPLPLAQNHVAAGAQTGREGEADGQRRGHNKTGGGNLAPLPPPSADGAPTPRPPDGGPRPTGPGGGLPRGWRRSAR